jgi:lipoprotein NlpI
MRPSKRLEQALEKDDLKPAEKLRLQQLASDLLHRRGEDHFRAGRISEAVSDFDREIELHPSIEAQHWQRGIAYYYAERFDDGVRQFKLHQSVNPQDVENAAWHFLCACRRGKGSVEEARQKLIDVTADPRTPMAAIQRLYAGDATPAEVFVAAKDADASAVFYADLYVALYYEALGRDEESLTHLRKAADNKQATVGFMMDVAKVHEMLRRPKD